MTDKALGLLGLMRRAGALAIGEENTGAAVHRDKAKLLLTAADASPNAQKRAHGFAQGRQLPMAVLPYQKETLSALFSLPGCSMAAVTDAGFAAALMEALAKDDPERYGEVAETLSRERKRIGSKRRTGI